MLQYGNVPTRDSLPTQSHAPPGAPLRTAPGWGGVGWGGILYGYISILDIGYWIYFYMLKLTFAFAFAFPHLRHCVHAYLTGI